MMDIDLEVRTLAEKFLAERPNSRGAKALRALLERGEVSTDDLKQLGYEHPPRALEDVKDFGIPIRTELRTVGPRKRRGFYTFGTADQIRAGMAGRTNIPKAFREKLLARYGSRDCITEALHESRNLQVDHRIPFRVAGDATFEVEKYMLLDRKSQRLKSFSCEQCENFRTILDSDICRTCYWAFPENYSHVAMQDIRRADVVRQRDEVLDYERLKAEATRERKSIGDVLKELSSHAFKKR